MDGDEAEAAGSSAVSYMCSILPPESAGICFTPATAQEVGVALMVLTNSSPTQYVFRITAGDGSSAFVADGDFGYGAAVNARLWYDIYACPRRMFCIQGVYLHGQLRGAPAMLRVYAKTGALAAAMASRMTMRTVLDNEQALVNLLLSSMGRVIVEPASSLGLVRDTLMSPDAVDAAAVRQSGIPPSMSIARGTRRQIVPARRALAPEQRAAAQALADVTLRASPFGARLPVRADVPIVGDLALDLNTWALQLAPSTEGVIADWRPRAGFVAASRGGGRRRTLAALVDVLTSTSADASAAAQASSTSPAAASSSVAEGAGIAAGAGAPAAPTRAQRLTEFAAPRLVIIACADASVDKWCAELDALGMPPPAAIIRQRDDYDALTYRVAAAGGAVLVTHAALAHAAQLAKAAAEDVRLAMHADAVFGSGMLVYRSAPPKLNHARCVRVHVGSYAARFPDAAAPLSFLRSRCVIVDDVLDVEPCASAVRMTTADARSILRHVSSLSTDWAWLVAACTGPPPTHLPLQTLDLCEDVLALPELARFVDEDARFDTLLPDVWRLVHEPAAGLVHRLCIPKALIRKVTIVPVLVTPTDAEVAFVDAVRRMSSGAGGAEPLPHAPGLSLEQRSAIMLCAAPAPSADGSCALHVALARTAPFTLAAARASVAAHFGGGRLRGTLAQRIMGTASATAGCEAVHAERALEPATRESTCQICFTDPPTRVSLCGHAFCGACTDMLRRPERRAGTVPCPCCRAPLSAYDWLALRDADASGASGARGGADEEPPTPSKLASIRAVLREAFGRRRPKRRCAVYTAWVVAPSTSSHAIAHQLREGRGADDYVVVELDDRDEDDLSALDEPVGDADARAGRHRVFVLTFEELSARCARGRIGESVEAIVLACPAPSTRTYYELVSAATTRATALQTHILVASGLEDVRPALQSLLEQSDEPVRRIIRRPSRRAATADAVNTQAPAPASGNVH